MVLRCVAARSCKLLSLLRRELGLSSSLVKRLKWQDALLLNGQPAHTDAPVAPGDEVRVEISEQAGDFPAENLPLEILFEDEFLIALEKPPGMLVHPSFARNTGTLANGLKFYFEQTGQPCAIHPVSRLDRDTFGVVLLAKSAHVHAQCCRLHQTGGFQKFYHATVCGGPETDAGVIDLPIGRVGGGSLLRQIDPAGLPSRTEFTVLRRDGAFSLLALRPLTGRTHQLRLHCLSAGFPILGDPQYQTPASAAWAAQYGLAYQQLCAVSLEFRHPMTGEQMSLHARQQVFYPAADNTQGL